MLPKAKTDDDPAEGDSGILSLEFGKHSSRSLFLMCFYELSLSDKNDKRISTDKKIQTLTI